MKIFNYLILSLLILGSLSCSSDDDNSEPLNIVGNWSITEGYIEPTTIQIELGGMPISMEISGNFVDIDDENRVSFKEDNTFTSITNNISLEMNMVIMGVPQTQVFESSDIFGQGTWEMIGNELKIQNQNNTSITYTIDTLDGNTLELSSNVKDMQIEGGANPMLDNLDILVKIKFKRV